MNEYKCYICTKKFKRHPSTVRDPTKVCCSKACRDIAYIEKFKGQLNPNYRHGEYVTGSFCLCGNPKDHRAKRCSSCARRGFAKEGARTIFDLDEECLRDMIANSLSLCALAKTARISRQALGKLIDRYKIDTSHFVQSGKAKRYLRPEIVLIENSGFGNNVVRHLAARLNLLENKCYKCGIITWRGENITLQLHHKNGDSHDNRIENLTILCPNCHSQTDTYKGKNRRKNVH